MNEDLQEKLEEIKKILTPEFIKSLSDEQLAEIDSSLEKITLHMNL